MATTVSIVPAAAGDLHRAAPTHPLDELRAARRDRLAALPGCTASDLLQPGVEGEWCGRGVLLHVAAWLRELACLVPGLATDGYQRAALPGAARARLRHPVRPEATVAGVVTAHARLLAALEGLDDAGLRRRGPTCFGFEASGWDLLVAEAVREREHAARLAAHARRPSLARDPPGRGLGGRRPAPPARVPHTSRG